MRIVVRRASTLRGELTVPGDKSISHRALILAALGSGPCTLRHLAPGADVRSTADALRQLGVGVEPAPDGVRVAGVGLHGLRAPAGPIDCGNSGTTARLLCGVLAGAGVGGTLDGDASLRGRPMLRVTDPLRAMGAAFRDAQGAPSAARIPFSVLADRPLRGAAHRLEVASAQVKSAILLAALWADGATTVEEPWPSRDHTERMLTALGVSVARAPGGALTLAPPTKAWTLPDALTIPGDPSSAAFALAAGVLVPNAQVDALAVDVNPTRTGFLAALERMGAHLTRTDPGTLAGEPTARIRARGGAPLRGISVGASEVPAMIDEIPLLAVLATQAAGTSEIRGAGELRVKESDRLRQVASGLAAMGARIEELPDGLRIDGPTPLHGARIDAARDHRIAMSFAVAALVASGETVIDGAEWARISFPGFFEALDAWTGGAVAFLDGPPPRP